MTAPQPSPATSIEYANRRDARDHHEFRPPPVRGSGGPWWLLDEAPPVGEVEW